MYHFPGCLFRYPGEKFQNPIMRAAVIDIGSNFIQLLIGERENGNIRTIESIKNVLPVGQHAFLRGRISQEIINQTIVLLNRYSQVLKEYEVTNTRVVATTAVREARNKDIFLDTVSRKTGFLIEIFNVGDVVFYLDAFLSHKLIKAYPIHEKNLIIAELGAGSLDISVMERGRTIMNVGFPLGTLRLKQFSSQLEGTQQETYSALKEFIDHEIIYIKNNLPRFRVDDVILIDENYSPYIQNILPNSKRESNFFRFNNKESKELLNIVTQRNLDEITSAYQIPTEVANTVDGYALIVDTMFNLTPNKHIYILQTSLSEAILANMLFESEISRASNKVDHLISVATFLCKKYCLDLNHARQVAQLAEMLFQQMKGLLGLKDEELLYLVLAAYLHDIGMFVNNRAHHKHAEYIISSLNLFRLTEEEMKIIACVARYHRKAPPLNTHPLYNGLPPDKQILVQKLGALMRLSNALDGSHKQKVKKLEVNFTKKQDINLVVYTADNFALERVFFLDKKGLFEEISGNKISLIVKNPS
jgi:exopolyphosphatase / guanosine-5'-triphosphate,3'-diphosphate pyrophosphatase